MKTTFLPKPVCALAATAVGAILSASALAQVPAPGAPAAPAATAAAKPLSPTEKNFIKDAGKSIHYQIQLATAAKADFDHPNSPLVRLRKTTISDLNKAWEALNKIAKAQGEELAGELTGGEKATVERLGKMKDDKFIKQWLEELQKESKKLDRDFESAARTLQDPDLKTFAANYSAIVHNVFTSAETAQKGLKKK